MPPSPTRQMVTRKTFAATVVLLVVMFGATTFEVWQLERGQAHKTDQRNRQLCAVISQLPADPIVSELRDALGCPRRMPQRAATTAPMTVAPPALVTTAAPAVTPSVMRSALRPTHHPSAHPTASQHPTPRPTVTVTRTPKPPRPSPSPSCSLAHPLLCLPL